MTAMGIYDHQDHALVSLIASSTPELLNVFLDIQVECRDKDKSKEAATWNGLWPGSYGYRPMPVGFGDDQAERLTSETDPDVGETFSSKADEDGVTQNKLTIISEDDEDETNSD